jgi:phosphate/sulfate permease
MLEDVGVYVIAPVLSTVTAGALAYAGKTLINTSKIQKNLIYRVEKNEEEINEIWNEIKRKH